MNPGRFRGRSARQIANMIRLRLSGWRREICRHDPAEIMVFITNRCNLVCYTCPFMRRSPYSPVTDVPDLSPSFWREILEEYPGAQRVGIVGGEPLLHPEWPEIVRIAAARRMEVNLSTNGVLLDDDRIAMILDLPIGFLNVSLDASTSEDYRRMRGGSDEIYHGILGNVRRFAEARARASNPIRLVLSHVTDTVNLERIPAFARLAIDLGADQVFCQNMLPYGSSDLTLEGCSLVDSDENRRRLNALDLPSGIVVIPPRLIDTGVSGRNARCKHPFRMLTMDGAGNLSPCCVIPPHPKYGDMRAARRAWRSGSEMRAIRKAMLAGDDAFAEICLTCWERFTLDVNP